MECIMIYWILIIVLDGQPTELGVMRNQAVCNKVAETLYTHSSNPGGEAIFYCQQRTGV